MTLDPNDLLLFARIVDAGSLSAAALRLGLPKSTVSRRLAALEAQLGERLMLRTTRRLTLTDIGRALLEHARQVVEETEAAAALAQHHQAEPSGRLRVSMPADFATVVLAPLLARFVREHAAISLELDLTARRVDLVGEGFDLALRMGELADDATLAARRIAVFSHGLYASPEYLRRRGRPRTPAELMQHDTLRVLQRNGEPQAWRLARDDEQHELAPPLRASANAPDLLSLLARQGVGITAVADHFAEPHVAAGELVPVLPDWDLPGAPVWAVFPGRRLMPARTRVFLDALAEEFVGPRCEAQQRRVARMRGAALA